jgi:RecJ-like exonuclease
MSGVLVECPVCRGTGALSNGHPDPQLQDDGDCHACSGGGSVFAEHREQLLDGMTDEARAELQVWEQHRALEAEERWIERERLHALAERDREWWA